MRVSDFSFDLPPELIASHPTPERTGSRLLCLDGASSAIAHRRFTELLELLRPNDLLVFNDTRVIPARLFGHKATGGALEIMVERVLDECRLLAMARASKSPKPGSLVEVDGGGSLRCVGRQDEFFVFEAVSDEPVTALLTRCGHMPLPPYIQRQDQPVDQERYQTVYALREGAVAAPTAGLHFDQPLLAALAAQGIEQAFVTLHVGAGTFQPVRVDRVEDHQMHSEWLEVSDGVCQQVAKARAAGGRVIAVGTTAVRSLETAAQSGELRPYAGETKIFITPGYRFQVVDALITNFHLPESTLLMLVSAFAGREAVMDAYHEAIAQRYRFFSYGDAMWLTPSAAAGRPTL